MGGGLPYSIEDFAEICHDQHRNIFPLLTNMCYKTTAQIKYEMIGFTIVLIVLI